MKPILSGVLPIDKPARMTSHDVVGRVRRTFGQREVGHTGTLDPMATGLMLLTLGKATRLGRFLEAHDKRYEATVTLGRATTTFDAEGDTTETRSIEGIDRAGAESALARLTGARMQRAPAFSAIKVGGERLYAKARRGEEVEVPVREVTVFALELTGFALPDLTIRARVSKGTYIRSLAVEIGEALGVPAHLSALRRTHVGAHTVEDARPLDALEGKAEELIPMAKALDHLPALRVDAARADDVVHGRVLSAESVRALGPPAFEAHSPILLLSSAGELLAVGETELSSAALASAPPKTRAIAYACVLAC